MKKVKLEGIITPILTPMNSDESINLDELGNQIERLIDGGVHGLFPFGTNGEGYILSENEKIEVLEATIDKANGRLPVYAGSGCISTADTVRMSVKAQELGADVLSIITPSFALASQKELYDHYVEVAKHVEIPIVLYNIPARTGNKLLPETVAKLAKDVDVIVGVKDSSGNWDNLQAYISYTNGLDKEFYVLSGNDSLILPCLKAGGSGAIAGCSNVYPHVLASIYDLFKEGKLDEAQVAQDSIASFREVFKYGNPNTVVKKAVSTLGYPVGDCRRPFNYLSDEGIKALEKVLKENSELGMK
ncbi:4-hydroxy-tetrahydrodipicolinate synthase [Clostridium sp. UBA6640]|uniref:4-hydroxy-tetrahydrodipicolinate synthase n=1 Tax=Clostridium sp. UBA6640 TaxID=1946370 RepID=UPI0025C3317C|nr:4-hydroxy-tetrahydrodipicolinate synthase [Clostridium sp. UBA6640]